MQAGIIDKDMPIDASNVAPSQQGQAQPHRLPVEGRQKVRVAKHGGGDLDEHDRSTRAPAPEAALRRRDPGQLKEQLGLANVMQVPRLEKIVVNMGVGRATQQPSLLEGAVTDLTIITGQKPIVTKASKSIAGFKLREGQSIGAKVTLRGDRMWEFLDRLITRRHPPHPRLPRPAGHQFDGRGNYTFGVNEQLIFPEIDYDRVDVDPGHGHHHRDHRRDNDGGRALLEAFGSRSSGARTHRCRPASTWSAKVAAGAKGGKK